MRAERDALLNERDHLLRALFVLYHELHLRPWAEDDAASSVDPMKLEDAFPLSFSEWITLRAQEYVDSDDESMSLADVLHSKRPPGDPEALDAYLEKEQRFEGLQRRLIEAPKGSPQEHEVLAEFAELLGSEEAADELLDLLDEFRSPGSEEEKR